MSVRTAINVFGGPAFRESALRISGLVVMMVWDGIIVKTKTLPALIRRNLTPSIKLSRAHHCG